jgi:hypothetical protein
MSHPFDKNNVEASPQNQSRNIKVLSDFIKYCVDNPELRFWQALRNWSDYNFIYLSNNRADNPYVTFEDPFYWEDKNK